MRTPERATSLILAASILAGAGGVIVYKVIQDENSKSRAAAAAKSTEAPTVQPTLRPITPTEAAVIATVTRASSPTATPTATDTATRESSATAKPTLAATATVRRETPTPEGLRFGEYKVYVGDVTGGGSAMISSFPDGRLAFILFKPDLRCSDPTYVPYVSGEVGSFNGNSFDFRGQKSTMFDGKLVNPVVVIGTIKGPGYEGSAPSGRVTCPPINSQYTLREKGEGQEVLIAEYRKMRTGTWAFQPGTSDAEVKKVLERTLRIPLP